MTSRTGIPGGLGPYDAQYKVTLYLLTYLLTYIAWTSAFIVHILHNRQCLESGNRKRIYTYPYQTAPTTVVRRCTMYVATGKNMDALASPAMGHVPPLLPFNFLSLQSRENSESLSLDSTWLLTLTKIYRPVVSSLFIA